MHKRTLLPTAAAVTATALLGGLASRPANSTWYRNLRKPPYQPPRQVFPIVWPLLYTDIAVVSASVLEHAEIAPHARRRYIAALAANLALNAGWSWLFFNRRRLGASAVAAALLTVSSADLTRRATVIRGAGAAPLGLYPAWCGFATALSTHIWSLNGRRAVSA